MADEHVPLIDPETMGRRVRAARFLAGYDRAADVIQPLMDIMGRTVTERAVYGVERGENLPAIDLLYALTLLYRPPGGLTWYAEAIRADIRDRWLSLYNPSPEVDR